MSKPKYRALVALVACIPAFGANAQGAAPTRDERALIEVEKAWIAAETRHDAAALSALLDDSFIATFGSGKPLDKPAFVKAETDGPPDPTVSQEISDRRIIVAGRTAVIIDIDTLRRVKDGQPSTLVGRFTATYIKRGDRWLALAEQGSAINP